MAKFKGDFKVLGKPDGELELSDCGAGSGVGGGFGKGNTCATNKSGKPIASDKAKRAAANRVHVGRAVQRYSEEMAEGDFAKAIGGTRLDDNEPSDVNVQTATGLHGIELKVMTFGKNDKITMKKSARDRKAKWEVDNAGTMHTVVIDDRDVIPGKTEAEKRSAISRLLGLTKGRKPKRKIENRKVYYRKGFGSFRISSMQEVTIPELRNIMGM